MMQISRWVAVFGASAVFASAVTVSTNIVAQSPSSVLVSCKLESSQFLQYEPVYGLVKLQSSGGGDSYYSYEGPVFEVWHNSKWISTLLRWSGQKRLTGRDPLQRSPSFELPVVTSGEILEMSVELTDFMCIQHLGRYRFRVGYSIYRPKNQKVFAGSGKIEYSPWQEIAVVANAGTSVMLDKAKKNGGDLWKHYRMVLGVEDPVMEARVLPSMSSAGGAKFQAAVTSVIASRLSSRISARAHLIRAALMLDRSRSSVGEGRTRLINSAKVLVGAISFTHMSSRMEFERAQSKLLGAAVMVAKGDRIAGMNAVTTLGKTAQAYIGKEGSRRRGNIHRRILEFASK